MSVAGQRVNIPSECLAKFTIHASAGSVVGQIPNLKWHSTVPRERLPKWNLILNRMGCENCEHQAALQSMSIQPSPYASPMTFSNPILNVPAVNVGPVRRLQHCPAQRSWSRRNRPPRYTHLLVPRLLGLQPSLRSNSDSQS